MNVGLAYWQGTCQLELGVLASDKSAGDWRIGKLTSVGAGVLASYMSAGAWHTGELHVSWSLAYWRVTCQLELSVLASYMSVGAWRTGK